MKFYKIVFHKWFTYPVSQALPAVVASWNHWHLDLHECIPPPNPTHVTDRFQSQVARWRLVVESANQTIQISFHICLKLSIIIPLKWIFMFWNLLIKIYINQSIKWNNNCWWYTDKSLIYCMLYKYVFWTINCLNKIKSVE